MAKRETGVTSYTLPNDVDLVITRVVDAPRRLVFDAYTKPEHIRRWLLGPEGWTMPVCELDLRPGGAWRYVWRKNNGTEMALTGIVKEVRPPELYVSTESWGGDWPETVNTIALVESEGQTIITTTVRFVSHEARERALATPMKSGMEATYARLEALLRTMA